jgi:CRP-like cAMP-binding protein
MNRAYEVPRCENCILKHLNVFADLNPKDFTRLNNEKSTNIYKHGQILFYEGNHPSGIYCVSRGKVKIYKTSADGREHIVRLAKEGDLVGYRALIGNESYSSSAVAVEDSVICFIPDFVFKDFLTSSPKVPNRLIELMYKELKQAETRAMELAQKPVRQRVAETILLLMEFYGLEADGKTINTTLTRIDIASIAGAATETTIRFLSDFRDEKLIEFDGKKIIIVDSEGLNAEAKISHGPNPFLQK